MRVRRRRRVFSGDFSRITDSASFIYAAYKPEIWYWEILEARIKVIQSDVGQQLLRKVSKDLRNNNGGTIRALIDDMSLQGLPSTLIRAIEFLLKREI